MSNGYILRSGGGSGIDFSVSNYASKEKLPAIAKENSFAIISDIPAKEYILSGVKPNANSVGDVWCNTSSGKNQFSYNALKRNSLIITPTEFFQWNGEAWIYKLSYVFKGGQWISLERFLISGGKKTSFISEIKIENDPHKIFYENGYISFQSSGGSSSLIVSLGYIKFDNYKKILIEYSTATSPSMKDAKIEIALVKPEFTKNLPLTDGLESKSTYAYDIRELKDSSGDRGGAIRIKANISSSNNGEKLRIYNMWLEGVSE